MPCILEDGSKLKVQVIAPNQEPEDEQKKEVKTVKKPKSGLLSIFQKVIEDDIDGSENDNELGKVPPKQPTKKMNW